MPDFKDKFLDKENFYLAFKKLKGYFQQSNEWYNPVEFSTYEANLTTNIFTLIESLKAEEYTPKPIQPLPFPKKNKGKDNRLRQYFRISIDDQLVWIAITNVIGQLMEKQIPYWSYGNRLYRQIWFDEENGKVVLRKGNYVNSSEHYYRKWNQSWPFFRRHISMTVKTMAYNKSFEIDCLDDEIEKELYIQEGNDNWSEYPYLNPKFWKEETVANLYWAGLDYTKFFQSIQPEVIITTIKKYLIREDGTHRDDCSLILSLIERMMKFPLDITGWKDSDELKDENKIGLKNIKEFNGIPTGLIAAGFLANIAMIEVDKKITKYIEKNRNIAVFKYVDDQVILCPSKDDLLKFLNFYDKELKASGLGVTFQKEKLQPSECFTHSDDNGFAYTDEDKELNKIDVNFPEPLMTHTLQKMSNLNDQEYELADDEELEKSEADLAHFLLADFPDSEMRRDTRMAFASMKLCQLAKQIRPDFKKLDQNLQYNIDSMYSKHKKNDQKIKKAYDEFLEKELKKVKRKHEKIFNLLIKAAYENPDKLKLWKRCVEFCFNTGVANLKSILSKIDDLNFDAKGKQYLQYYCLLNISNFIIRAYNVSNSNSSDYWSNYTAKQFLSCATSLKMSKRNLDAFPFIQETVDNYEVYRLISKKDKLVDHFLDIGTLIPKIKGTFENYLWDILSKVNESLKAKLYSENIQHVSIKSKVSWNIFLLYPEKITTSQFDEIQKYLSIKGNRNVLESFEFNKDGEGILYQIFESNTEIRLKYRKKYPILTKSFEADLKEYISLKDWLQTVKHTTAQQAYTDPRLSEWTFLQIIIQVSEAIIKERQNRSKSIFDISNFELDKIHPSNYLIPTDWATDKKITWEDWRKLLNNRTTKVLLRPQDELITDFRFLPFSKLWQTSGYSWFFGGEEFAVIVGLCVLLTQLLAKSFEWPSIANKNAFIDQVYSRARHTVETQPISSDTRLLLNLIFSKRNIDYFSNDRQFIGSDGDAIKTIKDFSKKLREIQKTLEETHLTLIDHSPRQLTIIDIDKLNEAVTII